MLTNDGIPFGNKPQKGEMELVVIRKDGTIEDLGVVVEFHKNPIKNWWINHKRKKEQIRRMKQYDN